MIRLFSLAAALILAPTLALADLVAENPWVRLPPPVATEAAGYLMLTNKGDAPVKIVAASSDICQSVEFHNMMMHGNMMHMMQVKELNLAPNGKVEFGTGGMHIMFNGLKAPLKAGQKVSLTLVDADGKKSSFTLIVKDAREGTPAAAPAGGHEQHRQHH